MEELIMGMADNATHLFRLSYVPHRKQWICLVDGHQISADTPNEAVEQMATLLAKEYKD